MEEHPTIVYTYHHNTQRIFQQIDRRTEICGNLFGHHIFKRKIAAALIAHGAGCFLSILATVTAKEMPTSSEKEDQIRTCNLESIVPDPPDGIIVIKGTTTNITMQPSEI